MSQRSQADSSLSSSSPDEEAPFVAKIHVHSASHLLPKDLNATSDPFVRIFFDNEVVGRTDTRKSDLNPVWNEEFTVPIYALPSRDSEEPAFKFEVLNEYKFGKMTGQIQNIGKHAFLGQVVLPLSRFIGTQDVPVRQQYSLEKRSHKSRVRGYLQLTIQVISRDDVANYHLPAHVPSDLIENARRRSHLSVGEMADLARALYGGEIRPGQYTLRIRLERAFGLPQVDKSRGIPFHFRIVAKRAKGKSEEFNLANGDSAPENMSLKSEIISLPITVTNSDSSIKIFMVITNSIQTHHTLGQATLSLGLVPVVESEGDQELDRLVPVDLYIEKKKLTIVPPYMKLRSYGSICKLRFSAWLVQESLLDMEEDEEDLDDLQSEDESVPEAVLNTPRPEQLPEPYEWELASVEVTGSVHKANQLMFDENSPVLRAMCAEKGLTELSFTVWTDDGKRDFCYLIPKTSVVKANRACEHQKYLVRCQDAYVMEIETETPDVPFGKDFVTQLRIFLLEEGPKTVVRATGRIVFSKSSLLKGTITRSAKAGMAATYNMYLRHLQSAFKPRRKRGKGEGNVQEGEDESLAPGPQAQPPSLLSPQNIIIVQGVVILLLLVALIFMWRRNSQLSEHLQSLQSVVTKHISDSPVQTGCNRELRCAAEIQENFPNSVDSS